MQLQQLSLPATPARLIIPGIFRFVFISLALCLFLLTGNAVAEPVAPEEPELLLDEIEAAGLVLRNNENIKTAKEQWEQVHLGLSRVETTLLPQIQMSASYARYSASGEYDPFAVSNPSVWQKLFYTLLGINYESLTTSVQDQHLFQARFHQPVFVPTYFADKKTALYSVASAQANLDATKEDILLGAFKIYYGLVSAQKGVDVSWRSVGRLERARDAAEFKLSHGKVTKLDTLQAEVELSRVKIELFQAESAETDLEERLKFVTGMHGYRLKVVPPERQRLPQSDMNKLLDIAFRNNANLKRLAAEIAAAEESNKSNLAGYQPTVSLEGSYQYNDAPTFLSENDSWAIAATVNWVLFDGGGRFIKARENNSKLRELRARYAASKNELEYNIKSKYFKMMALEKSLAELEKQITMTKEGYNLTFEQYIQGMISHMDVLNTHHSLLVSETELLKKQLEADILVLEIKNLLGILLEGIVEKVQNGLEAPKGK